MANDLLWTAQTLREAGWTETSDGGFTSLAGPFWHRVIDGTLECGFVAEDKHANRTGRVHGGMLATLADRTLGFTARHHDPDRRQVTIDLGLRYIDAAHIGELVTGTATILRETSSLAFMSGRMHVGERLIADMTGLWRIMPPPRTP